MGIRRRVRHGVIGATALVAGARGAHGASGARGASAPPSRLIAHDGTASTPGSMEAKVARALGAFEGVARPLSHPAALEAAVLSYFEYRSAQPNESTNPFLYFVDYGLPSTTPRGYLFDMDALTVVEGPFTVAHGRGSSSRESAIPTSFSNAPGSSATSLGLYRAGETYEYSGKANGQPYRSIGLRLEGLSGRYNDKALARHVVAHGAPYVTPTTAGRSEGCPAMEPDRARRLLPKLANGGLVFLFAPNASWLTGDPWLASADLTAGGAHGA